MFDIILDFIVMYALVRAYGIPLGNGASKALNWWSQKRHPEWWE
jgi:hypothetical protein